MSDVFDAAKIVAAEAEAAKVVVEARVSLKVEPS